MRSCSLKNRFDHTAVGSVIENKPIKNIYTKAGDIASKNNYHVGFVIALPYHCGFFSLTIPVVLFSLLKG
jgi:hypothetical protein